MIYKWKKPTGSGGRWGWAKIIHGVDLNQPKGAKQFQGKYLLDGENEIDGEWILEYRPDGSAKHPLEHVAIGHIEQDGAVRWAVNPDEHDRMGNPVYVWDWRKEYFAFRDMVQKCLGGQVGLDPRELEEQIDQKREELDDLILKYLAVKNGRLDELNQGLSLFDLDTEDVNALRTGVYMF